MILEKNVMRINVVLFHLAPMSDLIACCLFSLFFAQFPTLHDHSDGRVRGARKIRFDRVLCDVPCSGISGWHNTLHVAVLLSMPNSQYF